MNLRQYYGSLRNSNEVRPKQLVSVQRHHSENAGSALEKRVSFIIPTRDAVDLLKSCIDSLVAIAAGYEFEIIIVDNQSKNIETKTYLTEICRSLPVQVMKYEKGFNYAEMMNLAASQAKSNVLIFTNNDIVFSDKNYLENVFDHLKAANAGVVGCVLNNPDGTIQSYGVALGYRGVAGHLYGGHDRASLPTELTEAGCIEVSAASFALAAVRKSHFLNLGGLDKNYKVGLNDIDFCLRSRNSGFSVVICADSYANHVGSASRGSSFQPRRIIRASIEVLRFMRQYKKLVDPYFERKFDS